jgi:acetate kinase
LPVHPTVPLWRGEISWNSAGTAVLKASALAGEAPAEPTDRTIQTERSGLDRAAGIQYLLGWLWQGAAQAIDSIAEIDLVGHRVVHGGAKYRQPTLVDAAVQAEIDRLSAFAPLHNPANLMGIQAIAALAADLPQVAVFDTAFYGDLPEVAYVYPLPYDWLAQGIRKYGFHGISHQYCAQRGAQLLGRDPAELRLISCHLGNGCSLAAIKAGRCIETTMGFTPLAGLMMGTRCGSIDPGIILHLLRTGAYNAAELDRVLNFESGLLGVSGVSNDLREIDREIDRGNTRAKLALDLFIHYLTMKIAAFLPILGGLDAVIFTAGIGENHAGVRAAVAEKLAFLGVEIDAELNSSSIPPTTSNPAPIDRNLSPPQSPVKLLVIHTQEEWQIATACWHYCQQIDRD